MTEGREGYEGIFPSCTPTSETDMEKFKAYRIFGDGNRIAGRVVEMSVDELSPGGVVVKTAYSSVNYKDALAATGSGKILRREVRDRLSRK